MTAAGQPLQPQQVLVQCTSCNQPGFMDTWSFISSATHTDARDSLLQGQLFKYTCPVCNTVTTMAYPCMYFDQDYNGLLLYSPDRTQQQMLRTQIDDAAKQLGTDTAWRRLVFTTFEFCEKARLWAEGYDDRVIELMKVAIKRGMLEEGIIGARDIMIYERTLDDGSISYIVSGEIPGDSVGVPQGYTYLKDQWQDALDELHDEYCFDAAWANAFLP